MHREGANGEGDRIDFGEVDHGAEPLAQAITGQANVLELRRCHTQL
jgi:hypothetical protein